MSKANLYGQDSAGNWVPLRVGATGLMVGQGGNSDGIPTGQPQTVSLWSYAGATGGITDTANVTLAAAPGVGKSNYLKSLQVINSSVTATEIVVKDGSTTVIWRSRVGASMTTPINITFDRPLYASNNTALTFACITTSTATIVSAQGYVDATIAQLNAAGTAAEEIFDQAGDQVFDASSNPVYMA